MRGVLKLIPPCIPDSHAHSVTDTECRTDTVISPDDGRIVARNVYRKEMNMLRKIVRQVGFIYKNIQSAAFNVTHFESRITHLLYTAINTTEHGQVSQCLGFTKSLTSSIQRLGDVLHDNQGIAAISQVHSPRRDVQYPA